MTNSPRLEHPHLQGFTRQGFYGGVDVSCAPENNIKALSREVQECAEVPPEPISPDSNHTGVSEDGSFVKVDSPDQDSPDLPESRLDSSHGSSPANMSTEAQDEAAQLRQAKQTGMNQHIAELPAAELPDRPVRSQSSSFPRSAAAGPAGRQAGPPRRQQQANRPNNHAGYMGGHGMYHTPQQAAFMHGSQQYNQAHGQQGSRHPSSNGHGHHQAYHSDNVIPQSVAMTMMYNQQYTAAAQNYNQGVYPHQGPQHFGYVLPHAGVVWANQYDGPPQGTIRPTTAPVSASVPVMQYGMPYPPNEYMGGYYSQVPPLAHEAGMYYGYPGSYEPYMQGPIYNAPANSRKGSLDSRLPRQAITQYQPPPAAGLTNLPGQHGFKAPAPAVTGDGPRGKPGNRRQGSPPMRAEVDRDPHLGHRRQSSMPSATTRDRLQIQKGGDTGARRHRRTRSNEDSKVQNEAGGSASILEAIKTNRGNQYYLKDIAGHVYDLCRDQFGSRFIQMKIETASPEEVAAAFTEVCVNKDPALQLMNDVFGNYVVQKFLDFGDDDQKEVMAALIQGHVKTLSLQVYGCRVIQKAIEVLRPPLKDSIVAELKGHVIECISDQNGNHVIQKCIECITPSEPIADLLEELADGPEGAAAAQRSRAPLPPGKPALSAGFVPLARHPYGCRVVQRILEKCTLEDYKHRLVATVTENALDLARDTYGNYVIQHSLAFGSPEEKVEIIQRLQAHIVELSTHKFASNVVEKCLEFGTRDQRRRLVSTMLGEGSGLDSAGADQLLQTMTKDQYGNYVVQKTLESIKPFDLIWAPPDSELLASENVHFCPIERIFVAKLLGASINDPGLTRFLDVTDLVCTDEEREVLLGKIKEFLTSLKKQQYGKHIVLRIEKLLANAAEWIAKRNAETEKRGAETGSPHSEDVHDAFEQLSIAPETPESGPGETGPDAGGG
ncbi:ARM repeat-containing protein [Coccomyxa subellipsoidea C-169]|uniref:ARM repeat-containing protein n=1 Tax=Coccomyxa subellipsoidea (strain C-169) TaxID=574566 RepID=I0YLC6_COCSC|nr:ARM repeat-containing protein [Coccomyxa subellipsoidea C-169]EIE19195.1 ARM repeat-containing protein [Coccomyxa subellipsoidea C-169]|eukprot:XP_005643739.1 ARM repeat-containing protein [Coccomyxa subellipsoidea C-169]